MVNKKRILVPIDFSGDSLNALEYAINAANIIGTDVRMIHVKAHKTFDVPFYFQEIDQNKGKTVEDFMEILLEKYSGKLNKTLDYKVRKGKIHSEISNQARYGDSLLIVMGTQGVSGFEEFFIGSNAYKVVSNAPCPVITIRHGFMRKTLKKIVVPIDITPESRIKLSYVAELGEFFGAEIHIVSVNENESPGLMKKLENHVEQACEFFTSKKLTCVKNYLSGDNITDMTIKYANEVDACQ